VWNPDANDLRLSVHQLYDFDTPLRLGAGPQLRAPCTKFEPLFGVGWGGSGDQIIATNGGGRTGLTGLYTGVHSRAIQQCRSHLEGDSIKIMRFFKEERK